MLFLAPYMDYFFSSLRFTLFVVRYLYLTLLYRITRASARHIANQAPSPSLDLAVPSLDTTSPTAGQETTSASAQPRQLPVQLVPEPSQHTGRKRKVEEVAASRPDSRAFVGQTISSHSAKRRKNIESRIPKSSLEPLLPPASSTRSQKGKSATAMSFSR